jgi:hypothetical protein
MIPTTPSFLSDSIHHMPQIVILIYPGGQAIIIKKHSIIAALCIVQTKQSKSTSIGFNFFGFLFGFFIGSKSFDGYKLTHFDSLQCFLGVHLLSLYWLVAQKAYQTVLFSKAG